MRGKADAELGPWNTQCAQQGWRKKCVVRAGGGPHAFDQPAADHQIGARHPRLEQAVDRDARVAAPRRTHRDPVHRLAQHGGEFGRIEPRARVACRLAQVFDKARQRAPIGLVPQAQPAQRFARRRQRIEQIGQQRVFWQREQRREDRLHFAPPLTQPVFARELPQGFEPARRSGSTQCEIERADLVEPIAAGLSGAHQRVPEQRDQRNRRGLFGQHFGEQQEQAPRRGLGQGNSRRVVRRDAPAPQLCDDPARQPAIGGDQRDALFRQLERLAHQ